MEVYDMSPKVMGQSHEIMLALNQKKKKKKLPYILQAGFGGVF